MGLKVGLLPSKDPDNPVFITYSIFDHVFTVCQFWVYCSCSFEFDNLWFFRVRVRSCSIILEKSVFVHVRANTNEHQCSLHTCSFVTFLNIGKVISRHFCTRLKKKFSDIITDFVIIFQYCISFKNVPAFVCQTRPWPARSWRLILDLWVKRFDR